MHLVCCVLRAAALLFRFDSIYHLNWGYILYRCGAGAGSPRQRCVGGRALLPRQCRSQFEMRSYTSLYDVRCWVCPK